MFAIFAAIRYDGDRVIDTFGRKKLLEVGRMIRLPARLACGFFLDDRLRRIERIGGWRCRRIGGIVFQARDFGERLAHQLFQLIDTALQSSAAWTRGFGHADELTKIGFWQLRQV
jgi:hypothetical protein